MYVNIIKRPIIIILNVAISEHILRVYTQNGNYNNDAHRELITRTCPECEGSQRYMYSITKPIHA